MLFKKLTIFSLNDLNILIPEFILDKSLSSRLYILETEFYLWSVQVHLHSKLSSWITKYFVYFFTDCVNPESDIQQTDSNDVDGADDDDDWNLFRLLRSFSLPNLSITPLEDLYATVPLEITEPLPEEDVHPIVTFEDEESEDQVDQLKYKPKVSEKKN